MIDIPGEVAPRSRYHIDLADVVAVAVPLAVVVLLVAFAGADPTMGVTGSQSPFADEGRNVVNARNLVLLGRWSTDQFNLHLVNGPFSVLEAATFAILGVGIVQARLVSIVAVGALVLLLTVGVRTVIGRLPAALAGAALGTSTLVLFYGRLAYIEPVMMLELTAGALSVVMTGGRRAGRWGVLGGLLFGAAIATKANAALGAAAFCGAIAVLDGWRSASVRRWLGGVVIGVAFAAAAWATLALLPYPGAVLTDLRIWPHEQLPASVSELLRRLVSYPFRSDGGITALLPLGVGTLIATVAGVLGWRSLHPTARRLFVGSLAWIVVTLGALVIVSYRPNRYLLPVIPAMAILVGMGAVVGSARLAGLGRGARRSVAALTVGALCLPGLWADAGWMNHATYALPAAEESVAEILPPGQAVEGRLAPLLAMQAPVVTIVPWAEANANQGDNYATIGLRWVVTGDGLVPTWANAHAEAWMARRARFCMNWGGDHICLDELP